MPKRRDGRLAAIEAEVRSHGRKLGELSGKIAGAERRLADRIRNCEHGINRLNRTVVVGPRSEPPWGDLVSKRLFLRVREMRKAGRLWKENGFRNLKGACREAVTGNPEGFVTVDALLSHFGRKGRKEAMRVWMEEEPDMK